ncbi:O-antigen ligase family protein [uncultured Parasphingorhabdus sp.]|uniref:O-antigen ligase family protein n=1 Tax=uncultured Parasphingorhabdus sp. TaxID=2709694 RepID=UPI0030D8E729|tara:strand:- start:149108 stop:150559 length:1452 start_codon:yes stop_codon:yes gene_type:complete
MARNVTRKFGKLRNQLSGDNARFYAFSTFLTLVFFMGGSSRDDVQSLVFLRPLAVLFGAYALTCMDRKAWKGRTFPLYIALALAGLMIFQLIPLPPHIWTALPERQIFADIADLAGIEQPWRPLTLSPSRTLNSLFSLAIPISAMMLYLNLYERRRKQAVAVIITLAGISALWAAFQLTGSPRGPLYLYNVTNSGAAVGLFANRNHQAVLLAATIIMLGWYAASHPINTKMATLKFYGSIAAIFVLVPLIFITGSRAGLILMAPALVTTMVLIYFGRYTIESQRLTHGNRAGKKRFTSRQAILFSSIALVLIIAGLSVYFSRSLAFDRLFESSDVEELRRQLVPILIKMINDYSPWGSGFGSFEHVYRIYEPQELLNPSYLNQAHNDWLQFPIEGGLPAIAIAAGAGIWSFSKFSGLVKAWRNSRYTKYAVIMAAMVILIFLAGSIGDYPLRVPSLIALFAIISCTLSDNVNDVQRNAVKVAP